MVAALMATTLATTVPSHAQAESVSANIEASDRVIIMFDAPVSIAALDAATDVADLANGMRLATGVKAYDLDATVGGRAAAELIADLEAVPGVADVDLDRRVQATETNDEHWGGLWNLQPDPGVDIEAAWEYSQGDGAVVAVVDTGVVLTHADLAGQTVSGYDFVSDVITAGDGDGWDADPSDPGDNTTLADCDKVTNSSWHGTHVTGIIAGKKDNLIGGVGVAPQARVQPVRVLGKCGGSLSESMTGMRWAAGIAVPGAPVNATPARVINLSLGSSGSCPAWVQTAIDDVTAAGAIVVAAAGNDNTDASNTTPGNCANVITVASTNSSGSRSSFSNYGNVVDLAAPGSSIISTVDSGTTAPAGDTYAYKSGTSMATPHVAGVAALVLALEPTLSVTELRSRILSNTTPFGFATSCSLVCGAGIVSALGAVTESAALMLPGAPQNVTTALEPSGIKVSWAAPASSGTSTISQYQVFGDNNSGCITSGTSCIVEAITPGVTMTFTVKASNASGSGPASAPVTASYVITPDAVQNVTASRVETSVRVAWQAPASDGGSMITAYVVTGSQGGTCTTNELECTVTGLTPGSNGNFTVTATNAKGTGPSVSTSAIAIPAGAGTPDSIQTIAATDTMFVMWRTGSDGLTSSSYVVTLTPGGATCATTALSCEFSNLTPGTTYSVSVGAVPLVGATSYAAAVQVTTGSLAVTTPVVTQPPTLTKPAVKAYSMKRGAKVALVKVITTKTLGKRTWSVTGGCKISGKNLVAPKKKATCTLKLKIKIGSLSTTTSRIVKVS